MPWQSTLTALIGPGLFAGITTGDWVRVLRENGFAVHPRYALRAASISSASVANLMYYQLEERVHGDYVHEQVAAPLFVLGHWRSGTTHLHNLLAQDERFAFPNVYQVLYPHSFLLTEKLNTRLMSVFMPPTRFGLDNVRMSWTVPYEDEFALATMSTISSYATLVFPRRRDHYDRFLTMRDATPQETARWKNDLMSFLKKLTYKYDRPLILKSPGHTCRIRLLLELFPEAKFLHIRRHPFEVFRSMQHMLAVTMRFWNLQNGNSVDWQERVVQQYREMYDVYFEDRALIPAANLLEISFEDLEADPRGLLRMVYERLGLPSFDEFEPALGAYLETIRDYQKNPSKTLPDETRARLAREWEPCFDEWKYT